MSVSDTLAKILAYIAESKCQQYFADTQMEKISQNAAQIVENEQNLANKAQNLENPAKMEEDHEMIQYNKTEKIVEKLDCIFDNSPLGFERPQVDNLKMLAQDPLEEINLGTIEDPRPTYISKLVLVEIKSQLIDLLHEFKDCFA